MRVDECARRLPEMNRIGGRCLDCRFYELPPILGIAGPYEGM